METEMNRRIFTRTALALTALVAGASAFAQSKVVMGVAIPAATHGWAGGVVYWANRTKGELEKQYPGMQIIVKTAGSAAEQANQVQDLQTVNKIDTLVILPFESAPLTQPVAQLKKKGVFVTVVDRGLTDTSAQDAYVAGDNPGFGKVSAEYMAKALGGKGDMVILRGIPTVIDNQRVDSFTAVMKTHPGIKILDAKHGNWNRDDSFKVMQDYLTRFPHIDAVWASDDDMAVGVQKAIEQAKRGDVKLVIGGAGAKDYVKKVMDGDKTVTADVTYSPSMIADAMKLTAAARAEGGKAMAATTIIPSVLITKDNASKYYFPDSPF
jgi:ribose transport system substrate-binding protein